MKHRIAFRVQPMLATLVPEPFDRPGWAYEEKYDGDRILAYMEDNRVHLPPETTKTARINSLELPRPSVLSNPSPCFSMATLLYLIGRGFPDSSFCSRIRATRCTPFSIAFFTKAKISAAKHCPQDAP